MRRVLVGLVCVGLVVFSAFPVLSGNPHFIKVKVSVSDTSLSVSGKEAGLGNEDQVHIEVSADAACINPGGNHPHAGNKESFSVGGDFPVQNGKANFSLTLVPTFQPDCTPPMTVEFSNIQICDTTHGICY